ncbi:MAG: ribose 5-phosphate isomerase B [Candidatus Muiribacteriota bacterium]
MKIIIASDHGGFNLKNHLINFLKERGNEVVDIGCGSEKTSVDYPDYASECALKVANREADFGIMIDGAGIGSTMVANKIKGIRAALCNDLYCAENARAHNNANMLVLGAQLMGNSLASKIADKFLNTSFEGGRHKRRVDKINQHDNISSENENTYDDLETLIRNIVQKVLLNSSNSREDKSNVQEYNERVLTEDYLKSIKPEVLKISSNTIILPVAADYIRQKGIQIIK